jgi:hypothetical protein
VSDRAPTQAKPNHAFVALRKAGDPNGPYHAAMQRRSRARSAC